jgi:hypothetical protein
MSTLASLVWGTLWGVGGVGSLKTRGDAAEL